MEAKEKMLFRRIIAELETSNGAATSMVSLYVPPDRALQLVIDRLRDEMGQAENVKSRVNRQSVVSALTMALNEVRSINKMPPNGFALFAEEGRVRLIDNPPEPIESYLYECGPSFVLKPLKDMMESKQLFGLIVMDRKEASIGLLRGTRISPIVSADSRVMGKHKAGGQSANRYARQIEEATENFYKKISEMVNNIFLPLKDLRGIIVGGPALTKKEFLEKGGLDYRLRALVLPQLLDTGYTDEFQGLRELVAAAGQVIKDLESKKEADVLGKFMRETAYGIPSYGPTLVMEALERGMVEELLLSEELSDIERFITAAEQRNVKVTLISTDSDEGRRFLLGFGGVGAFLWFKGGPQ